MRCSYASPIGTLILEENSHGMIIGLHFANELRTPQDLWCEPSAASKTMQETFRQLDEYFAGKRREFSLPLDIEELDGTNFQKAVWRALCDISYGRTATYAEIAEKIGNRKACRAVGGANHVNPISIIIPCHRVVAANGLGGYGGGLDKKIYLLNLERGTL